MNGCPGWHTENDTLEEIWTKSYELEQWEKWSCTFHCRVSVLLVRWDSLGGKGTSGTLQCVVNEPASEHKPRTELYIAETLKQTHNHVIFSRFELFGWCNI